MENNSIETTESAGTARASVDPAIILWGISALVVALLVCNNNSPMALSAGFFAKVLATLAGTALGLIGALLGNALRKFAAPDTVFTTGGFFKLIWIKVFWRIGPQVIGLIFGAAMGVGLVLR